MSEFRDYRKDFPMISDENIYFDSAATAHKPQVVIDTISDFYSKHYGTVNRGVYSLARQASQMVAEARCKVQNFIKAKHFEEIIFTKNTTSSLNLIARSYGKTFINPGDVIIISEAEHHSNIVPWQMLCEERGAILHFIPVNDRGELILDEFINLLNRKVKLVSIAHISNVLGTIHPVKEVIRIAHEHGAHVCIDGAQAVSHIPVDVQELDADFYAFSGHKLYGPTGIGVLYGKRDLLEKMEPIDGGGDMIEKVSLFKSSYANLPNKFEAGTPMISEIISLGAAIDYISQIGFKKISPWEKKLLLYATKKLQTLKGLTIIGSSDQKGAIISFVVDGVHSLDLGSMLDLDNIFIRTGHLCSQPSMERFGISTISRISFGLYNTIEEIDKFMDKLTIILLLLKSEDICT